MTDEQELSYHLETRAIVAGRSANGRSLSTPLWATTTYESATIEEGRRLATTPRVTEFYSRYGNPTVRAFEEALAALEGAEAAQAFGSGMGAVSSSVLAMCSQGDHIVAQSQLYSATSLLFQMVCPRFGIDVTYVDATDSEGFAAAVQPGRTRLIFVETPANPVMQLVDLEAVGAIPGPIKVVDSTFAGPMIQRPLAHGFDLVVHSATKSLAGHNDATLGVVAGAEDLIQWIWSYHTIHGAVASPFDALNGLRGIRTLGVRIRQQSESALRLAEALDGHEGVLRVNYPGLESHPQRDLAKRQMDMGGGMLSFDLAGGLEAGRRFVESVHLAHVATSLGGTETLMTHPASTTAANLPDEDREMMGIGEGLVRVSVGLEHPDDIIADVMQALAASGAGS
ncbi:MAG: aminotransferase class I/II-fold pyridoxal phosphate-dependent enzyme [Actinobacteria bacterium]|nr:aminotransferase class I/II-fold pyridoxal phosphate-dependent enzyme [Actinomycetota bacterium]MBI3256851.1 aminotransferase class I/II-fold pyridoxal phosphate-dependent enzyme [Actinomycetota bacterium]